MAYVSTTEYREICGDTAPIPESEQETALAAAEKDIDTLTFNRIVTAGIDALTSFQQGIVKRAVCYQANFRYEYGALLDNPLSSYGINGVSMSFDSSRLVSYSGVTTLGSTYALLRQTGLTFRGVG